MEKVMKKRILSQKEAREALGLTFHVFSQIEKAGLIKRIPKMKSPYYKASDVERLLEKEGCELEKWIEK